MKLGIYNCPRRLPARKISLRSDDVGGLDEYPVCYSKVYILLFFFFGLFVTCTGRIGLPILTIYASYGVFPRNGKSEPFGVSMMSIIMEPNSPKTVQSGREEAFSS